jgi:hypothetical protein
MCTSVITPRMLHVEVITSDYITLSQPKAQQHYQILHSKVKLSCGWLSITPLKHTEVETQLYAQ